MAIKTIFLDRDGVINKEVNYLYKINDFQFIEGIFDACSYLEKLGYKIIIITNQAGIAKNFYSIKDYQRLSNWMLTQFIDNGVEILDIFYCPHGPETGCECRKPKPGMLLQADAKYDICMEDSWMIGDKETDIEAAHLAGIVNSVIVKTGHKINEKTTKAKFILNSINQITKIITH
jgi:D-glycero-D-manno-heptose 1,7-bisphosphate phosphatase